MPYLEGTETSVNPSFEAGFRGDLPAGWSYEAYVRNSWGKQRLYGATTFNSALVRAAINNADPSLRPILLNNSERILPNSSTVMNGLIFRRPITNTTDTWEYGLRADGPIWTLPSGEIQAAVSTVRYEYYVDTEYVPNDPAQNSNVARSVNGSSNDYTGQLQIPLAGGQWRLPLVRELKLNVTTGGTRQNLPKGSSTVTDVSVIWQPFDWFTVRANRSESYKVPTLYQALRPSSTTTSNFAVLGPLLATYRVFDPARGNTQVLYTIPTVTGGNPDLLPENGETRGASIELNLPFVRGLKFAAVYSETSITNQIVFGNLNFPSIFSFFPERLTRAALTPADQALGYTGGLVTSIDATNLNLAQYRTENLDLSLEYRHQFTNLGRLVVNVKGTKPIRNYEIAVPGATPTDNDFRSAGRYTATLSLLRKAWTYGAAVSYDEKWNASIPSGIASVPAYTKYDAWVGYDFGQSPRRFKGWLGAALADLSITVRGLDIFPQDPQFLRANGYILGRGNPYQSQYQIDVRKKF